LVTPTSFMSVDVAKAEPITEPGVAPTTQARLTGVALPVAPATRSALGREGQPVGDARRATDVRQSGSNALASGRFHSTHTRAAPTSNGFTRQAPLAGWGKANSSVGVASRPSPGSASSAAGRSSSSFGAAPNGGGGVSSASPSGAGGGGASHGSGGGSHH